ncbi:membrane protein [Catellatospora sp. TT07R-123]|uniref:DoxX family protein n=1 Tax=Catellatospora sp. TT07R-123 TaxID=2733863 RepID=UPI001AFE2E8E|nr:DoxX family protein [Catellatospora sp. TT07R-123]GHJ48398.1 membrane protein [Catellatospora sp. TT07R-123]
MITVPESVRDLVKLLARLGIGVIFFAHGWQKLFDLGIPKVTAGFRAMGVPLPGLSAWFATFVELVGGALLVLGLFTPIVGLLLAVDMLGAYLTVHIGHGLFVSEGGAELVISLGLGALLLAAVGAGRYSLDHVLARGRVRDADGPMQRY